MKKLLYISIFSLICLCSCPSSDDNSTSTSLSSDRSTSSNISTPISDSSSTASTSSSSSSSTSKSTSTASNSSDTSTSTSNPPVVGPVKSKPFEVDSIPSFYITTTQTIDKKEYVKNTTAQIVDTVNPLNNIAKLKTQTKCRGNSTFLNVPAGKYSYKVKFNTDVNIFGFGAHSEWNLLANYMDRSFSRTYITYQTTQFLDGLADLQIDCAFVELYITTGSTTEYRGLYLLTESIEVGKNRLEIDVPYNASAAEIPFMVELDYKAPNGLVNGVDYFLLDSRPFAMQYPSTLDVITQTQRNFITSSLSTVYSQAKASKTSESWSTYIDSASFIDYFIMQELYKNPDTGHSSFFFYKPLGQKMKLGPVWDFDLSMGNYENANCHTPAKFVNESTANINTLYNYLMQNKNFKDAYIARWNYLATEVFPIVEAGIQNLRNNKALETAATRDNAKWNVWGRNITDYAKNPDIYNLTSFIANMDYISDYMFNGLSKYTPKKGRVQWLTENLKDYNLISA